MQKRWSKVLKMKGLTTWFQISDFRIFQGRASNWTIDCKEIILLLRGSDDAFLPEDTNGTFLYRVFLGEAGNAFLHQNGNIWIFIFFTSMCLRIRGKLFLVVSYHVFGKENITVSMLWLQVDSTSRSWVCCGGSHGQPEGGYCSLFSSFSKETGLEKWTEASGFGKPCKHHVPYAES